MRQVEGHKEPGQKVTKALGVTNVEKGSRPTVKVCLPL